MTGYSCIGMPAASLSIFQSIKAAFDFFQVAHLMYHMSSVSTAVKCYTAQCHVRDEHAANECSHCAPDARGERQGMTGKILRVSAMADRAG